MPVFYEVGTEHLHHYADFGLTFVKLGEEARVDLSRSRSKGAQARRFRQALRRLEKDGGPFRVVPADEVPAVLPSCAPCPTTGSRKAGAEKGFSLGFFDADYVARFPVAVVERDGRIVGVREPLARRRHDELSVDLMRYTTTRPRRHGGLLRPPDELGQGEGYRWFALGMAPLSGFERRRWRRSGTGSGVPLRARRGRLQLPGPARVQGQVRPDVGAALPRVSRRLGCRASWPTCRRWSPAAIAGSC